MAKVIHRDKNTPSIKKNYIPNSVKYKRILIISVLSNLVLLFLLINKYL